MALAINVVALTVAGVIASCGAHSVAVTQSGGAAVTRGDSIQFSATSRVSAETLVVRVSARNAATHPVSLAWGACSLDVLLYRTPSRTGTPAFDWARRAPEPGQGAEVCPLYMATHTLAPGDTITPGEFTLAVPIARLRVDSLGAGTFFITARLLGVAVPAGSLELR